MDVMPKIVGDPTNRVHGANNSRYNKPSVEWLLEHGES
jgi:hypothetical protein